MHVKEIYVIFIHLFDSGILLIIDLNKIKGKNGGILRNSPEPTACVYCDQNNSLIYGKDTLRSRVGNIHGCQMCTGVVYCIVR
jgi:hypothetical protein